MSLDAWGDGGDSDGSYTEDRVSEIANDTFIAGFRVCREMMARFVEQGGDAATAQSIRANWNPAWGNDPGKISDDDYEAMREGLDAMRFA